MSFRTIFFLILQGPSVMSNWNLSRWEPIGGPQRPLSRSSSYSIPAHSSITYFSAFCCLCEKTNAYLHQIFFCRNHSTTIRTLLYNIKLYNIIYYIIIIIMKYLFDFCICLKLKGYLLMLLVLHCYQVPDHSNVREHPLKGFLWTVKIMWAQNSCASP